MNLPNVLTVARIIITFIFIYFLLQPGLNAKCWAFALFVIASATDWLDGYIARRYKLITDFGKLMDPIADKFLTLSAFFVFAQLALFPMWMTILIGVREIGLTVLRMVAVKKGKVLAAENLGKYKTVFQILTIIVILLILILQSANCTGMCESVFKHSNLIIQVLMWMTLAITLYSGATNFYHNRRAYGL